MTTQAQRAPVPASPHASGDPFARLQACAPDPLLSIIRDHARDPRPEKVDLGVGVYREEDGSTPVMQAVKEAEWRLASYQTTKAYLGTDGDRLYLDALAALAFGHPPEALASMQTVGGTGALRLAGELLSRTRPDSRVWMTEPSWPIHRDIFRACDLAVEIVPHLDASGAADAGRFVEALQAASAGDAVLLHACCHNPTGDDYTAADWETLAGVLDRRGLIPLIDCAYHGLAQGLEPDAAGMRRLVETLPNILVAYSCNKNFALYRDRTGALFCKAEGRRDLVQSNLMHAARRLWSMPPDHGAAVVRDILMDKALRRSWEDELAAMRRRI